MSDLTAHNLARRPQLRWGWFVALGVLQLALGIVAWFDVIAFTIAGVIFIGALLVLAGVFQIVHAFMDREWGGFALHVLIGLLYVVGGFLLMDEPIQGSLVITILVAAALVIGGILRIAIGIQHRHMPGWVLMILGGLISLVVGVMLYLMLPWSGLWVVGTLIAVELIVHGVSWIQFGSRCDAPPDRHNVARTCRYLSPSWVRPTRIKPAGGENRPSAVWGVAPPSLPSPGDSSDRVPRCAATRLHP